MRWRRDPPRCRAPPGRTRSAAVVPRSGSTDGRPAPGRTPRPVRTRREPLAPAAPRDPTSTIRGRPRRDRARPRGSGDRPPAGLSRTTRSPRPRRWGRRGTPEPTNRRHAAAGIPATGPPETHDRESTREDGYRHGVAARSVRSRRLLEGLSAGSAACNCVRSGPADRRHQPRFTNWASR